MGAGVPAFVAEGLLVGVDIVTVPREEVGLFWKIVSESDTIFIFERHTVLWTESVWRM